jgi:hypothetical protein
VEVEKWGHGNVAVVIDCVDAEAECAPPTCAVKGDGYDLVLRIANLQMKMMTEQMGARMGWNWRWNLVLRAVILQGGVRWTLQMKQ